jgi:Fur family transcriptional regulator, ferric uptake regulator
LGRALSLPSGRPLDDPGRGSDQTDGRLHVVAEERLAALDLRYTASRRRLVETMERAGHPLTIGEILRRTEGVPQSSAYRNVTVLCDAGIAVRLPGADEYGRFELAEDLAGHHHHLVCRRCDLVAATRLERVLREAASQAVAETGFEVTGHRLDFEGLCRRCGDGG